MNACDSYKCDYVKLLVCYIIQQWFSMLCPNVTRFSAGMYSELLSSTCVSKYFWLESIRRECYTGIVTVKVSGTVSQATVMTCDMLDVT